MHQEILYKISHKLAKIHVEENDSIIDDIEKIIAYVNLLNQVDTTNVPPTVSVVTKTHIPRASDTVEASSLAEDLLACSPQQVVARQISLPYIFQ